MKLVTTKFTTTCRIEIINQSERKGKNDTPSFGVRKHRAENTIKQTKCTFHVGSALQNSSNHASTTWDKRFS